MGRLRTLNEQNKKSRTCPFLSPGADQTINIDEDEDSLELMKDSTSDSSDSVLGKFKTQIDNI